MQYLHSHGLFRNFYFFLSLAGLFSLIFKAQGPGEEGTGAP